MATGPVMARVIKVLEGPIEKPVIIDTYYVPEIEQIMLNLIRQQHNFDPTPVYVQDTFAYLRQGDFFTCALNSQVNFWLGALLAAGRINQDTLRKNYNVDHMIDLVPLGLPDDLPPQQAPCLKGIVPGIGAKDKVLYWGGGIWDWTDPFTFMDALKIINRERSDVRVVFGALHHYERKIVPEMNAAGRLMERINQEGWLGSKVFFLDWVNYDQRSTYLLESDLGVSLAPLTLESRFAIRSRLLDHLWTGLPGVLSRGDEMADVLASIGLAKIVEPGDASATARAILEYLETPVSREHLDQQLADYRKKYSWSTVVLPVVEFMRSPHRAPDADYARRTINEMLTLRSEWEGRGAELDRLRGQMYVLQCERDSLNTDKSVLEEQLNILRNSRPVRIADAVGNFLMKLGIKP